MLHSHVTKYFLQIFITMPIDIKAGIFYVQNISDELNFYLKKIM